MKQVLIFLLATTQLISCGQADKSDQITTITLQEANTVCLTSQSKCTVTTKLGDFDVRFSQSNPLPEHTADNTFKKKNDAVIDQILTELPFSIIINKVNNTERSSQVITISGYLEGKDMFMGKVPVFFDKEADSQLFIATSLLASCSENTMIWRLWLTVKQGITKEGANKEQSFFIDFESLRL